MKIILLDADPSRAALVRESLASEGRVGEFASVATAGQLREALGRGHYDVVLSDYGSTAGNDLEALRVVQELGFGTPVVLLADPIGEERAIEVVRLGAADCVIRTRMHRLPSVIERVVREAAARNAGAAGVMRDIADRNNQDEELRLFRVLVDRSNDSFEVVDPATARFLDVNDKACADLGYTREELRQLRVFDIDPDIDSERWAATMARVRQGPFSVETIHRRKDGSLFPVEVNMRHVSLHRDYLVVVARDITERKTVEADLRLQSSALASAANAIVITDLAGAIQWVNPAFCALTGYDVAEALGKNPNELLKSGQQDRSFYERMWKAILAGQVWRDELVNRRKDGTLYTEFQTITPVRDYAGRITHFVGVKEDITARKQAEERIREQAEIIDHAPLAILIADLDHRITYCNHGAVTFYGRPREEIVGRTAADVLAEESLEMVHRARLETLAKGSWHGEGPFATTTGRHGYAEFYMLLIKDALGRPRARLSIAIDLTEKKKLEEQFLRAQRLESLGMLAAGIAHDLNNVLAPVLMGAPLLRLRSSNPADLRLLETIENSANRGAGLVRQILSFAHGASGEKVVVQTKHLLRDIVHFMEETFPKSITLEHDFPNDLWPVRGSPTNIHQVVLNLCVNARDAMPKGGNLLLRAENRCIEAGKEREVSNLRPGAYLVIEVTDTGVGISPENLERIWDPFFTTKGEGKGTGLGLSTVRGIVASHDGAITVDSVPGQGTSFRVFLPAHEADTNSVDARRATTSALMPGSGELLLFVDDETSIRDIGATILGRAGYRVIVARDGFEALTQFLPNAAEIAVVITDLGMPVMDGHELSHAVRRLNPQVGFLFMSGLDSSSDSAAPMLVPLLKKPFGAEELLQAVRRVLDEQRAKKS